MKIPLLHTLSAASSKQWLFATVILLAGLLLAKSAGGVVINEVMYHPPEDLEELQYIELHNADAEAADLSGWKFTKGIKFDFRPGTKIPPGGFLVICGKRDKFVSTYGSSIPIAGEFEGHFSHDGERIELSDASKSVVDSLKYSDSAPWPLAPDGESSSLERICPSVNGDDPANWAPSKPPLPGATSGTPGQINGSFQANLPPAIENLGPSPASTLPDQPVTIAAQVTDSDGVKAVELSYQVAAGNVQSPEVSLEMKRVSGDTQNGRYEVTIPAQGRSRLVRYRITATNRGGSKRTSPSAHEIRTAWSYSTFVNDNASTIPFGILLHPGTHASPENRITTEQPETRSVRGNDAFVYLSPGSAEVQLFDFVDAPQRKGGFKVHFLRDQLLRGMTTINVIYEGSRYTLTESLSYEVFRLAGVPTVTSEHIRVWIDGRPLGYHLLVEQPNKAFLARNKRDTGGNLYKLIWYGNGVVGKHEKRTNSGTGHGDLIATIDALEKTRGAEQWAYIQKHFNVDEFINYFAVNMCIQNWDGFHNNYFTYHDTGDTGRWEIYPWDEDKTWGDYDGSNQQFDWYDMPLTFGMQGSQPPLSMRTATRQGGFFMWWREPGYFSGPLLANPEFRERFLVRLREICESVFTEQQILPLINQMEKRLEPEVPIKAVAREKSAAAAMAKFRSDIQSLRNQLIFRRKFILSELERPEGGVRKGAKSPPPPKFIR